MRAQDMELVDKKRQLLCAGKLFRQPDHPFERGQIELFVLLLDNYRQYALYHQTSSRPLTAALHSRNNKARGERARHGVSRVQTGKCLRPIFSVSAVPISPICAIANTARPFEARGVRGYPNPNKTQIGNLPWKG